MNVSHGFTHGRNECATGRPPASAVRFSTGVLSRVVATRVAAAPAWRTDRWRV
jgi:hypothetical protein